MTARNSEIFTSPDFHALEREVLERGGSFRFRARGWSMMPFVHPGDVLLVERVDPARLRPGAIIVFHRAGTTNTVHRLIRKVERDGRVVLIARGDNLNRPDEPIGAEQVLGRVVEIHRDGQRIRLDTGPGHLLGLLVYRLAPWRPWRYSWLKRLGRLPWWCVERLTWRKT